MSKSSIKNGLQLSLKDQEEFRKNYFSILFKDEKTNGYYFKVPVESYVEVCLIKSSIISAIQMVVELQYYKPDSDKMTTTLTYLTQVLDHLVLFDECSGLMDVFGEGRVEDGKGE